MIKLHEKDAGTFIGDITEEQLQILIDELEEEDSQDKDYYINRPLLESFKERNVDSLLVSLLEQALGDREDMDIIWSKEGE